MTRRKKRHYGTAALFVIVAMLLTVSGYLYSDILEKSTIIEGKSLVIQNLNSDIEGLTREIEKSTAEILALESNISFLENKERKLNILLGRAEDEVLALTPKITHFFAAGVDQEGKGKIIPLDIKTTKGTGLLSVNIKGVDLQSGATESVRTASLVASGYTGIDISQKDITVSFVNENSGIVVLDGPSAGAAVTVGIIASLEGKELEPGIMMTGSISSSGRVGEVGGVEEKAIAARDAGAKTFLVPKEQDVTVSGIDVVEVRNIDDVVAWVIG